MESMGMFHVEHFHLNIRTPNARNRRQVCLHALAQPPPLQLAEEVAALGGRLVVQREEEVDVGAGQLAAAALHHGGGGGDHLAEVVALSTRHDTLCAEVAAPAASPGRRCDGCSCVCR